MKRTLLLVLAAMLCALLLASCSLTGAPVKTDTATAETTTVEPEPLVEHTVSFVDGQGNKITSQLVLHGSNATLPTTPGTFYTFSPADALYNVTEDKIVVLHATPAGLYEQTSVSLKADNTPTYDGFMQYEATPTATGLCFGEDSAALLRIAGGDTVQLWGAWTGVTNATATLTVTVDGVTVNRIDLASDFRGWLNLCYLPDAEEHEVILYMEDCSDLPAGSGFELTTLMYNRIDVTYTTFTVTFAGEGVSIPPQAVRQGLRAHKPEDPQLEGYRFCGWTLYGYEYDFSAPVVADITLVAVYERVYTVSFEGEGVSIPSQQLLPLQYPTKPRDPSRVGYRFEGWYLGEEPYDWNTPLTGDLVLTAKWAVAEYTVSFEGLSLPSLQIPHGGTVPCPSVSTDRAGYEFLGWYENDRWLYNWSSPVLSDLVLIAKWAPIRYTITYELNGGVNHPDNPDSYTVEDEIVFAAPTRVGHAFAGWDITGIEAGTTGAITVTAQWTVAPTLNVDFEDERNDIIHYIEPTPEGEAGFVAPNGHIQTTTSNNGRGRTDAGMFAAYTDALTAYTNERVDMIKCKNSMPLICKEGENRFLRFVIGPESGLTNVSTTDNYSVFSRYYINAGTMNGRTIYASTVVVNFGFRMSDEAIFDTDVYLRGGANNGRPDASDTRTTLFTITQDGSVYYGFNAQAKRQTYHDGAKYVDEKIYVAEKLALGEWHNVTLVMEERLSGDGYTVAIAIDGEVKAENLTLLTGKLFWFDAKAEICVIGTKAGTYVHDDPDYVLNFDFDNITITELE